MPIQLMTAQGEALLASKNTPWDAYPRPQLRRDNYVNLNGTWEFTVSPFATLPEEYKYTITVPFCPESVLSGLSFHPRDDNFFFYRRQFSVPLDRGNKRILLHVGAADQAAKVYVNEEPAGTHPSVFPVSPVSSGSVVVSSSGSSSSAFCSVRYTDRLCFG